MYVLQLTAHNYLMYLYFYIDVCLLKATVRLEINQKRDEIALYFDSTHGYYRHSTSSEK